MTILATIKARRSIRKYAGQPIGDSVLEQILESGRWAPSGLNNQPWKFIVVRHPEVKKKVAKSTECGKIVEAAAILIAVFLDKGRSYNHLKDVQAIGACIQNMLLAIHDLGLGGCWLGEILNKASEVEKTLGVPDSFQLMAVVAIGHPKHRKPQKSSRIPLKNLIYKKL